MSIVNPRPYYVCDYCGVKHVNPMLFKYTDNSGLDNKVYDMCSENCYKKHISYLTLLYGSGKMKRFGGTLEEHINDIWGVTNNNIIIGET